MLVAIRATRCRRNIRCTGKRRSPVALTTGTSSADAWNCDRACIGLATSTRRQKTAAGLVQLLVMILLTPVSTPISASAKSSRSVSRSKLCCCGRNRSCKSAFSATMLTSQSLPFSLGLIGMGDAQSAPVRTMCASPLLRQGGRMPWFDPEGGTDDAQGGNAAGTYDQADQ